MADWANPAPTRWAVVDSGRVQALVDKVIECLRRTELPEEDGVKAVQAELLHWLDSQPPLYTARLPFLFVQDMYTRALFSPEGRITRAVAERAAAWTRHQLQTPLALWPPDVSKDLRERMYLALVGAFIKHGTLSATQAKKFAHTQRPGAGGIVVFNHVLNSMRVAGEIAEVGKTRRGQLIWRWVGS